MKVLFLDIDGVLNSRRTYEGLGRIPHNMSEEQMEYFDWTAVGMLRKLAKHNQDLQFVLSSSWRITHTVEEMSKGLGLPITSETDTKLGIRGEQIQRWLDAHPEVEQYVIVDDDSDMLRSQADHFVQTNFSEGFLYKHFERCKNILEGRLGGDHRELYWEDHPTEDDDQDRDHRPDGDI